MVKEKQILIVDDEENMRHMLAMMLNRLGYAVLTAEDGQSALNLCRETAFDFILCDIRMPGMDGMTFLQEALAMGCPSTIIMMSAFGSVDIAIQAIQLGAYDYISKPFKPEEIHLTLKKAEEREELRKEVQYLHDKISDLEGTGRLSNMVGRSKGMREIFSLTEKVARHRTTVLITGESGTGKELVARGIHDLSPRKNEAFVAVNCGSLPETLIESELFGYVRGAFTGADRDKKGLFQEANRGTLFLDEIGELPLTMQVKLLRALQEDEVQPVGAAKQVKVDVRVVAATAKDLELEVQQGRFRQDLFYRLNVVRLMLPPLRDRQEDIGLLAEHFLARHVRRMKVQVTGISPAAMNLLLGYAWPGNVRELENVLERAVIMAEKQVVLPENLPEQFGVHQGNRRLDDIFGGFSVKQAQRIMEHRLIERALEATGFNKSKAAALLELSYPSLLSKIKEYGITEERE